MIEPISKENPVYLYKLVRYTKKNPLKSNYKEFILVRAWSSANNDLDENKRYFDYYYNGRLYRDQEVAIDAFCSHETSTSFNIWMYDRNDKIAISECREWLNRKNDICRKLVREKASKLITDRLFTDRLNIREDELYESKL